MKYSGVTASDVTDLYLQLEALGIEIRIDGGWGVDALLGRQTRAHGDIDIVVQAKDVPAMRAFLDEQGFEELERDDTRPWNFVLGDREGREVDVHVIVLDTEGNGIYGPPQNGESYPAAALLGRGIVGGLPVRCLSPEYQLDSRTGYDHGEADHHDLRALAEKFGLELAQVNSRDTEPDSR